MSAGASMQECRRTDASILDKKNCVEHNMYNHVVSKCFIH